MMIKPKNVDGRLAGLIDHLSAEMLTTVDQFAGIRNEWENLFAQGKNPCVFQSFTWNYLCWKHLGGTAKLAIIAVRENENLVGIGPFVVRSRLGQPQIEPLGANKVAYHGLLVKDGREDVAEAIAAKLVERFPKGIVHIPYYSAGDSAINVFMASLMTMGWREARWVRDISHYIYEANGFDDYMAHKSTKSRQTLRYKRNKLEKSGKMSVHHFCNSELSTDVLERIAKIQKRSWLVRRGVEAVDSPFYKEAIPTLAQEGKAEIFILSINDADIAFDMNLCSTHNHYVLSIGFNEELAGFSPGLLLLANCIQQTLDRGGIVFDFLFGDGEYKRFWANRTNQLFHSVGYLGFRGWILSWFPYRIHGALSKYVTLRSLLQTIRKAKRMIVAMVKPSS